MDELHAACDKLFTEVDHFERIIDTDDLPDDPQRTELALSVAKRVRRDSTLVVRLLAALRDHTLQPKEGTST